MLPAAVCLAASMASAASGQTPPGEPPPIQDNSFLIEEAYNQEPGVVQHINSFLRNQKTGEWLATFTQEWPVPRQTHQLSYTIPYQRLDADTGPHTGLGDVALNYRYQLVGSGEAAVALAPRFSVLLPTGSERRGLGAGGVGFQINVPLSTVLSPSLVAHWNAGTTWVPRARSAAGQTAATTGYNAGQSVIWHAARTFDLMLETLWTRSEFVTGSGTTAGSDALLVNPGARAAWNLKSGLQVVVGIGVPVGVGPSRGQRSLFFYLSFEHPFRETHPSE